MDRDVSDPRQGGRDAAVRLAPKPLRLVLLGGFAVLDHGEERSLPHSVQRLVAFLALHPRPLSRSHVAGSLWLDATETRAAASLRSTLWRLQRTGLPLVHATTTHIRLAGSVAVDAHEVGITARRLLDRANPCSAEDLDAAPLTGELLPDWWADDWVLMERERLRQLCLHGLEALSERLLTMGRYGEAIEAALAAVRAEPLRESAHRILICVHLGEGNVCEALRQYRWYERLLREELSIEPSLQLTRLIGAVQATS